MIFRSNPFVIDVFLGDFNMKIAICDDSEVQAKEIASFLIDRSDFQMDLFDMGLKLLKSIQSGKEYDFILLDIKLTDLLGTDLAKTISVQSPNTDIIFVSAYPQYVTEAFHLRVTHFLLKPLTRDSFLAELDWLIAKREKEKVCWCVQTKNGVYRFTPSEVIYIESYNRHLKIQTPKEQISVVGKLSEAERVFESYDFRRSHQSFLVNLRYVKQIRDIYLICEPDFTVPVSVRKRSEFIHEYSQYLQRQAKNR